MSLLHQTLFFMAGANIKIVKLYCNVSAFSVEFINHLVGKDMPAICKLLKLLSYIQYMQQLYLIYLTRIEVLYSVL